MNRAIPLAGRVNRTAILLEPDAQGVCVTGCNGDLSVSSVVPGHIDAAIAVAPRQLAAAVDGPEPQLYVKKWTLTYERPGWQASLSGSDPDDYPRLEPPADTQLAHIPDLAARFRWVAGVAATWPSRPALEAVAVNPETGMLAAADGFRLRVSGPVSEPGALLIPARAARLLPPSPMIIEHNGEWAVIFQADGLRSLTVRLIQAKFPRIARLIPEQPQWSAEFEAGDLARAVRRLQIISDWHSTVRLFSEGPAALAAEIRGDEGGGGRATIPAVCSGPVRIALNPNFLLAALSRGGRLRLSGGKLSAPVRFDSFVAFPGEGGGIEVVMPMSADWPEQLAKVAAAF